MSNLSILKEIRDSFFCKEYYTYHQKNKVLFEYIFENEKYKVYINIFEKKITDGIFYDNLHEGIRNVLEIGNKLFHYLKLNRSQIEVEDSISTIISDNSEPINLFKVIDYEKISGEKNYSEDLNSPIKKIKVAGPCNLNNKIVNKKIKNDYLIDKEKSTTPIQEDKIEIKENLEKNIFANEVENEILPGALFSKIKEEKEISCKFEETFKLFCKNNELQLPEIKTENLRKLIRIIGVFCDEKFISKYTATKELAKSDFYKKLCESYELEIKTRKQEISTAFSYMDIFH